MKNLIFLFLISCSYYQSEIQEDKGALYSRLTVPVKDSFLNLQLQIVSSSKETIGYLTLTDFIFNEGSSLTLTLEIEGKSVDYPCKILAGQQKAYLPKKAVIQIISGLKEKNRIHIKIEDDEGYIDGTPEISNKLTTLCQEPDFIDTIIKEGIEYLKNYQ